MINTHNMKRRTISSLFSVTSITILFISAICSFGNITAQTIDNSGFMHTAGTNGEEFNALKIKFETTLNADQNAVISNELHKYPGIISIEFDSDQYVVLKFTNEISANQILAVLDRINHPGHYLNSGVPVYYQKDQNIYFIR